MYKICRAWLSVNSLHIAFPYNFSSHYLFYGHVLKRVILCTYLYNDAGSSPAVRLGASRWCQINSFLMLQHSSIPWCNCVSEQRKLWRRHVEEPMCILLCAKYHTNWEGVREDLMTVQTLKNKWPAWPSMA